MHTTPQSQQTGPGMSPDEARSPQCPAGRQAGRLRRLALTVVVSLACTMAANWRQQTTPTSPGLLVLMGVVTALPMLVAGWVIARRRG